MSVMNGKFVVTKPKFNSNTLFIMLFALMPIIDTLNGFVLLQLNINFSIGQIYRIGLIGVTLIMTLNKRCEKDNFYMLVYIITIFITLLITHIFLINSTIMTEISLVTQWLLTPILLFGFYELIYRGKFNINTIESIFNLYSWIVPLSIIIPKLFGLGFNTYGGNIGYKGFYYANNGISYLTSILIIFKFYKIFNFKITLFNIFQSALLIITSFLLGTKASILSIGIAVFFSVFLSFKKGGLKGFITSIILLLTMLFFIILFKDSIINKIDQILDRYKYMSTIYNESFFSSITTGRITKVDQLEILMKNSNTYPWNFLFGIGDMNIVAEMDPIDLFFSYGIIGLLAFIIYLLLWIRKIEYNFSIYKVLIAFTLVYSIVVGHVFNNSMSIMVFTLILATGKLKKRKE